MVRGCARKKRCAQRHRLGNARADGGTGSWVRAGGRRTGPTPTRRGCRDGVLWTRSGPPLPFRTPFYQGARETWESKLRPRGPRQAQLQLRRAQPREGTSVTFPSPRDVASAGTFPFTAREMNSPAAGPWRIGTCAAGPVSFHQFATPTPARAASGRRRRAAGEAIVPRRPVRAAVAGGLCSSAQVSRAP